jgi:mono/diheme cytochrome c family protein
LRLNWHRFAILAALALLAALNGCGTASKTPSLGVRHGQERPTVADSAAVARGAYLVNAAGCAGCHTDKAHGGAPFAGGRAIKTDFGTYYSRNITPDRTYGIGAWSDQDFIRALRRGISPSGEYYFPVFPFPSFTLMTDRDLLDIKAYLFTQKPEPQADKPPAAPFPFDVRAIMGGWRLLYFTEGPYVPDRNRSAEWNRGAYLVNGVSACGECHTPRNFLGALNEDRRLAGAPLQGSNAGHAPNITPDRSHGIGTWSIDDITTLLKIGMTPDGDFVGAPMSEVVDRTAKLTGADRKAIAVYLKSLPPLR